MRTGVRIGVDVGKARIGVARSDFHGMLATPVETVARDAAGITDLARLAEIAAELDAFEVVVGLPLNMRGEHTPSTDDATGFAARLAARLAPAGIGTRLVDERLSTVSAQGQLRQAGKKTKQSRSIIDQAAAVVILQHALDSERAQGEAPGSAVDVAAPDAKENVE
ncbi:Holliday junction resolvase RuvX [Leucobacter luti]|uniref:Putative pre-16S rRNA nuclease n=1 Tax=Leucobacter luti TaxID=340320 RepID=A0A4Q7TY87_9MICO|nr:Holliday junction resolvase RuvX [Leucobacter luti]MBL3698078.1 Holliday junction resolvase RuvX [Leucobacter luti]RZT64838.1 putative Holliday junction resolvase [Leucobacter luti]